MYGLMKIRKDGLKIFPDRDLILNKIRNKASKKEVILAVALRRMQQIAMSYTKKYAPELMQEISTALQIKNESRYLLERRK